MSSYEPSLETGAVPRLEPRRTHPAVFLAALLLMLVAPLVGWMFFHNQLVVKHEAVDGAWAQVESAYQRRADLVPALVEAVNRHMHYEAETLEAVTRQRGDALAALRGLGAAPDDAALSRLATTQDSLGAGIRQVLAIAESYPMLRSADQFLELQAQLEGSENRIHVARTHFNDAVRDYNAALEAMPTNWIAGAKGWGRRAYFESGAGAAHAAPLGLD